ncbi:MAG: hypothetical protein ACPGQS_05410 [Bradymonadia bacterium]
MTPQPNLPTIKFDEPYIGVWRVPIPPFLWTDTEGREVIWATPRYFLISPEIDHAALVKTLAKVSRARTLISWTLVVVFVTLTWRNFEFMGVNSFVWAMLIVNIVVHIEHRWFKSHFFKMLHPYADHLTEVSVKTSWQEDGIDATKLLAFILLVSVVVTAFTI